MNFAVRSLASVSVYCFGGDFMIEPERMQCSLLKTIEVFREKPYVKGVGTVILGKEELQ